MGHLTELGEAFRGLPRPGHRGEETHLAVGCTPEQIQREQALRDQRDASEARSVHEPAPDAVPVDTTGLTLDEVVAQVVTLATEARAAS